jgi:hypothetical protein
MRNGQYQTEVCRAMRFLFAAVFAVCIGLGNSRTAPAQTQSINLQQFQGKPYLTTLQSANGIYPATQKDEATAVTIAAPAAIAAKVATYDASIANNLYGEFVNGQSDYESFIGNIKGQSLTPEEARTKLQTFTPNLKDPSQKSIAVDRSYEAALLASGSGVLVTIDSGHSFIDISYKIPVVQSGRSYGETPKRAFFDQSDKGYLMELDAYIKGSAAEAGNFYPTILNTMTASNPQGLGALSDAGQVAATDFLTIYTAELIRHNMVGLGKTDPWEIDIGEVTLLDDYSAVSGKIVVNGSLVPGSISTYGSGAIGNHRKDFVALAQLIQKYEEARHPDLVSAVKALTPTQDPTLDSDVFRRVFVYLNTPSAQTNIAENATAIVTAVDALLAQVRADAGTITLARTAHAHGNR